MSDQKINLIVLVTATTTVILLLTGFIVAMLFLYQKKQFAFQKNMDKIKRDHEKDLLHTQLQIQEQTLENISRDIHDNISLGLTLSKLNLNTLNYPDGDQFQDKINFSVNLIGEAIQNLSNISKSLNAESIRRCGLLRSIENEIGNLEKTGKYRVTYETEGTAHRLDVKIELIIYRILQESFNNILKHAKASDISVLLLYHADSFVMTVRDNGVGFSFTQLRQAGRSLIGSGLNNMQQRAKIIGGECRVVSKMGEGTMVKLIVPLVENENNDNYG